MTKFELSADVGVPVAYIELSDEATSPGGSKNQVVVDISDLSFTPQELIFDLNEAGYVIGVELL